MSEENIKEEEEPKNSFRVTCECGSTLCSKQAISRHLKTRKHKIFIGEIIVPPKVKPEPKKRGRPLSPESPDDVTKILNSKVEELSEEQLSIRRSYFRKKTQEYRNRKKLCEK